MRFRSAILLASFAFSQFGFDCGVGGASSRDNTSNSRPVAGDATSAPGAVAYADAGTEFRNAYGSPLCGIVSATNTAGAPATCSPDESDLMRLAVQCTDEPLNDAGPQVSACRIDVSAGSPRPVCSRAGDGVDGDRCTVSSDCTAGFECVDEASDGTGGGVCRQYCCLNDCDSQRFCDLGHAKENGATIPVCVPVTSCDLLSPSGCAASDTCSVVRDDAVTSCVTRGNALAGQSCELERCGQNLACLGAMGMRKCVQLCRVTGNDCAGATTCRSTSLIKDPHIGICQ